MTWQEFILSALFDIACVEVDALMVRGDIRLRFECAGVDVGVVDIVLWLGQSGLVEGRDFIDFARNFFQNISCTVVI